MNLSKERTDKLLELPVTISGQWLDLPKRDWKGVGTASESLVAALFLRHGNIVEWCKSERGSNEGLEIRLALFPYDKSGLEVQVNFSVGGGNRRFASILESATYKPNIEANRIVRTGELVTFARVEGNPPIDLDVLFIARRNVQFGRKVLWHLRPEINLSLPAELNRILIDGRAGQEMMK